MLKNYSTAGISIQSVRPMSLEYCSELHLFLQILKIHFYIKMKIREIIFNDFDLNECYPQNDPEQHSKDFIDRTS